MANRSLGTLTLDLVAKTGSLIEGLSKAGRAADAWKKEVATAAAGAAAAVGAVGIAFGAAALSAGAATLEITKSVSETVTETDRWSKTLGLSISTLQTWQYAATKAGLSADNMADIFKDLGDKIGDAVLNKSGDAAQALDTLGLSAKKLQALTPDKQLLAISQAMEGMNIAKKTNIYESLGNDLTKLMPLLNNGAKGLKDIAQQGQDLGVVLPDSANANLVKFNTLLQDIQDSVQGLKNQIAGSLANVDLTGLTKSFNDLRSTITDPAILQALVNIANLIVTISAKAINLVGDVADFAKRLTEIPDRFRAGGWYKYQQQQQPVNQAKQLASDMSVVNPTPLITLPTNSSLKLAPGEHNQKQSGKTPGQVLDQSFKTRLLDLQKEAALIDVTGRKQDKATELTKLNFDLANGSLSKLNDTQKQALRQAAEHVDALNKQKTAYQENAKVIAYIQTLQNSNKDFKANLDTTFQGLGRGDQYRERLGAYQDIRKDFGDKQSDLQKQLNTGDISQDQYKAETSALQDALNDRLKAQQDYYSKLDDLNNDWQDGVSDGLNNYVTENSNYMQQAADATTSILSSATSSISDNLYSLVTGAESIGEAFKNVGQEILQSVVKALIQMAAQWLVNQAVMLALGTSSTVAGTAQAATLATAWAPAAMAASIATLGSADIIGAAAYSSSMLGATALSGMAHSGIDSVPETGTWLLQKGERVTTAGTSAKLDRTLDKVNQNTSGTQGNVYAPTVPITINGNPSDATVALVQKAAQQGADEGVRRTAESLSSGTGAVHSALTKGYGVKRSVS